MDHELEKLFGDLSEPSQLLPTDIPFEATPVNVDWSFLDDLNTNAFESPQDCTSAVIKDQPGSPASDDTMESLERLCRGDSQGSDSALFEPWL